MKESHARRKKRQPIPQRVSGDGSAPPRFRFGFPFCSCCLFRGVCLAAASAASRTCLCLAHATVPSYFMPYFTFQFRIIKPPLIYRYFFLRLTKHTTRPLNPTMPSMLAVVVVSIVPTHLRKDEAIFGKLFRNGFFFAEHTATISMIQLSVIWSWASITNRRHWKRV